MALVKLLNPAFYGKANSGNLPGSGGGFESFKTPSNISPVPDNSSGKPRSSSQTGIGNKSGKTQTNKRSSKSPIRSNKSNFEKDKVAFKVN